MRGDKNEFHKNLLENADILEETVSRFFIASVLRHFQYPLQKVVTGTVRYGTFSFVFGIYFLSKKYILKYWP